MFSCSIYPWMTFAVHTHRPWPLARPIGICIGYYIYIDQVELAPTQEPRSILAETILLIPMDPLVHSDRVLTDMIILTLKRNTLCMEDSSVLIVSISACQL